MIKMQNENRPSTSGTPSTKFHNVYTYKKLVVPVSMRSIYWKYFGFPAVESGELITRSKIICILCKAQIAYNKNTSNLRMHLQNKHMSELVKIEGQGPHNKAKQGQRRAVKASLAVVEQPEEVEEEEEQQQQQHYLVSQVDPLSINSTHHVYELGRTVGEEDQEQRVEAYQVSKKFIPQVQSDDVLSTIDAIANLIVTDLASPEVIDGKGLQRLLVTLRSPCEIPSSTKLTNELIPCMYKAAKEVLELELAQATRNVGLTLEEWYHISGHSYLSIGIYYHNQFNNLSYKLLSTLPIHPTTDTSMWSVMFDSLFTEWNLTPERITAAVVAVTREEIISALFAKGVLMISCVDYTIKECVRLVFDTDEMKELLTKIRAIVTLLTRDQQAADALIINESAQQIETSLVMDNETIWLTTLQMMEQLVLRQDIIDNIIVNVNTPLKEGLQLSEDEWDLIHDVITVLEPFKVTLMTMNEETFPLVSLLKPLLWQVISNRLMEKEEDSATAANLKRAIIEHLVFKYNDDHISQLLHITTMLDPRFKQLPYCSESQKSATADAIKTAVCEMLEKDQATEKPEPKKSRVSGMELLLGNYNLKKVKVDPKDAAETQYDQYYADNSAPLDSCPLAWWTKRRSKYPEMAVLAEKYSCVPACSILPGHLSLESQLHFMVKRASFTSDQGLIDKILFLHVNQTLPQSQTTVVTTRTK